MMARQLFVFLCVIGLCGGCSSAAKPELASVPQQAATDITPLPQLNPYRLQIGDVLSIKFLLNPELNEQVMITPDGMIGTAVVQNIMAYGRTAEELQLALVELYKDHLIAPKISVIVQSFAPTRVYVMGEVSDPGEYISIGPNMTLLQAIAQAGDIKPSANSDEVIILRRQGLGQPKAYVANYAAAASGRNPMSDVILASSDVIFVPRSGIADLHHTYQQYIQQFLPPSFGLNYQLNPDNN